MRTFHPLKRHALPTLLLGLLACAGAAHAQVANTYSGATTIVEGSLLPSERPAGKKPSVTAGAPQAKPAGQSGNNLKQLGVGSHSGADSSEAPPSPIGGVSVAIGDVDSAKPAAALSSSPAPAPQSRR